MNHSFYRGSFLTLALALMGQASQADVKLAGVFTDSMVLQRDIPIPVWGWADAGEAVTVQLGAAKATAQAGADGRWKVALPKASAGTGLELSVAGKNTIVLKDVAVGEVWVCSGQSNMEWKVSQSADAKAEIEAGNYPNIRSFTVSKKTSSTPLDDLTSKWIAASPATVGGFSGVGYYFGRELHQKLNVPIGLIHTSWGGTPAQAWASLPALESKPELKNYVDGRAKLLADFPATKEKYEKETLPAWQIEVDKAKAEDKPAPRKPSPPVSPDSPSVAANLFNAMIYPLIPYGIKGAIWYQGESNAGRAVEYRTLFPTMITDWRTRWGQGDFPFHFVQLANFRAQQTVPVENDGWPMLREAQTRTLSLPNTGMAVAIDLADATNPGDIHPKNKQDVGKRLALQSLAKDYGQKVVASGPMFQKMEVLAGKAHLTYTHTDGGLTVKPIAIATPAGAAAPPFDGNKLLGFAVKGEGGDWKWAEATIQGNVVVVSSTEVPTPVAVRYSWATNPIGNLYNGAGLPANPFRSDVDSPQ